MQANNISQDPFTMSKLSVGILIPTYQAARHLPHCLPPLLKSSLKPRILIIDSSSKDDTVAIARSMGVETRVIPQIEFNHGTTREKGRQLLATDIVVMVTQDAYANSSLMIEKLLQPLLQGEAAVAYARQLPHQGAGFLGAFARHFNYPSESHIRGLTDAPTYGPYTFFCSNSCAAYLNTALERIGGFPSVLFGEDTVVVAKLLLQGEKIAYVAEAEVRHSHDYTLRQEFWRHIDMGMARESYKKLLELGGKDSKRGKAFVKTLLQELILKKPTLIPYALLHTACKLAGYRLGQAKYRLRARLQTIPMVTKT